MFKLDFSSLLLKHEIDFWKVNKDKVENHTLEDFALNVISHESDSVMNNLQKLHYLIVPDRKGGGLIEQKGIMALLAAGIMVIYINLSWMGLKMILWQAWQKR